MTWFKAIFAAALSVIFVVSTFVALFGGGGALNAYAKAYIPFLQIQDCRYVYEPRPAQVEPGEDVVAVEPREECTIDYNRAKRSIIDGATMFIVFGPIALITFWQVRRMMFSRQDE